MPGTMHGIALAAFCDLRPWCLILLISGGTHPVAADILDSSLFLATPGSPSDVENAVSKLQAV